jgi:hypothetical protein
LVDWFAEIGGELVVEFPTRDDAMVKRLLLNRDPDQVDYSVEYFEKALRSRFEIRNRLTLTSGTRILYSAIPKETR